MLRQSFTLRSDAPREEIVARIAKVLAHLPAAQAWRVDLTAHEDHGTRSENQNRYLWGVVYPAILEADVLHGWTADDLHEYLLGEHFGWEVVAGFGKKRQRPVRRSSRLSKIEFMAYVAFIQQRMAEHGIYVPDPNEGEH